MGATKAGPRSSLSAKQLRFIEEYLVDLNATQAAIRAGYSEKGAHVRGNELLNNRKVSAAITDAQEARSQRTGITQDMVLAELARVGFADIRKIVAWGRTPEIVEGDGAAPVYPVELIPSAEIDDDTAATVSEVSLTAQGVKIKMHDKLSALEKIGRHLGMFDNQGGAGLEDAPALSITIKSAAPIGDVRVTRSNG